MGQINKSLYCALKTHQDYSYFMRHCLTTLRLKVTIGELVGGQDDKTSKGTRDSPGKWTALYNQ